jgi:hypothetical protein
MYGTNRSMEQIVCVKDKVYFDAKRVDGNGIPA